MWGLDIELWFSYLHDRSFLTELLSLYIQIFYNPNGYVVPDAGETDGLDNIPTVLKQMVFLCRGVPQGECKQICRRPWVGKGWPGQETE